MVISRYFEIEPDTSANIEHDIVSRPDVESIHRGI